jgi:hypothetical protein
VRQGVEIRVRHLHRSEPPHLHQQLRITNIRILPFLLHDIFLRIRTRFPHLVASVFNTIVLRKPRRGLVPPLLLFFGPKMLVEAGKERNTIPKDLCTLRLFLLVAIPLSPTQPDAPSAPQAKRIH